MEVIENTMALRDSLKEQLTRDAQGQADYDAVQTLAGIIPAGWLQQDMTVISGNQSAAAAVPTVQGGFNWAKAVGDSAPLMRGAADLFSLFGSSTPAPAAPISAGALGSGTFGINDFSKPTFFASTSLL